MRRIALLTLISSSVAIADDGVQRERIAVGQTIERDVGYAVGVLCDDQKVVTADMKSKTSEVNVVVFHGEHEGTTTCRVGTVPYRVSFVFEITVTAKPRLPRRP